MTGPETVDEKAAVRSEELLVLKDESSFALTAKVNFRLVVYIIVLLHYEWTI